MNSKKNVSNLWFIGGFCAVVLAGIAKILIADHFSPEEDED